MSMWQQLRSRQSCDSLLNVTEGKAPGVKWLMWTGSCVQKTDKYRSFWFGEAWGIKRTCNQHIVNSRLSVKIFVCFKSIRLRLFIMTRIRTTTSTPWPGLVASSHLSFFTTQALFYFYAQTTCMVNTVNSTYSKCQKKIESNIIIAAFFRFAVNRLQQTQCEPSSLPAGAALNSHQGTPLGENILF